MHRRSAPSLACVHALLVAALALGAGGCSGCAKAPPIALEEEESRGPLVFPPAAEGWLPREPLPARRPDAPPRPTPPAEEADDVEVTVRSPVRMADGTIELENAHTITIELSEEMAPSDALAKAPTITISPPAPVRTVWVSPWTVELRADKPLDPSTTFTISLPEMTAPSGHKLKGGWKARFKPRPESILAGKTVPFVVVPGVLRPIYVRPIEDGVIGPTREMIVLYDQPIAIEQAESLVTAKDAKGSPVPLAFSHPPPGQTFEGEKIDTAAVLLVKLAETLAPGAKLTLQAASQEKKQPPVKRQLTIADLPKVTTVGCVNVETCDVEGRRVKASPYAGITIGVTNPVRTAALKGHVTVTPAVPNLHLSGSAESIYVDASWQAATTYTIELGGVVDKYGYALPGTTVTFQAEPRSYAAILREGVMILDEPGAKDFYVTTRNVKKGELRFWPVGPTANDVGLALGHSASNTAPSEAPAIVVPFAGATAPHVYTRTAVDLSGRLEVGRAYLAQVEAKEGAHGARPAQYPAWSEANKASVPFVLFAGKESVGAHVHVGGKKAVVQVYRLVGGEPVASAEVELGGVKAITDAKGTARLDVPTDLDFPSVDHGSRPSVVVRTGSETTVVPLGTKETTSSASLFPELAISDATSDKGFLGFVVTDRGIYQPGAKVHLKAHLRKNDGDRIVAAPGVKVRLQIDQEYTSETILDEALVTDARGAVAFDLELPESTRSGSARVHLQLDDDKKSEIAEEPLRIATFERPRFLVDLADVKLAGDELSARVSGRYPFGAPMEAGRLAWTVSKKPAEIDGGALAAKGFSFGRERRWSSWDDRAKRDPRPTTGEAKLDAKGDHSLRIGLGPNAEGPVELLLEADVTDSSYRHVAAKASVVRHPGTRYSGLRVSSSFGRAGTVHVDVGAVDLAGKAISGVPVEARVEQVGWKRTTTKGESGALLESWVPTTKVLSSCTVTSDAASPPGCDLKIPAGGEYQLSTKIDGREDASVFYWAWGEGDDGAAPSAAVPSKGNKIPVSTDRKRYKPGDVAKVLAQSPYAEATALLTIENGGVLTHEVKEVKGAGVVFDVPVTIAHAPHAHAVVTLLPRRSGEVSYRVGAVRLPVALEDAALSVSLTPTKKVYEVKDTAEITVEVKRAGKPVKNADVTLAVVDEGVLRMTGFHAKDPTKALHPARGLDFVVADSRTLLFRRRDRAHAPGGGGADEDAPVGTRRDFADTALWRPDVVTGDDGKAKVSLKLPDNLTEWRITAVVIDESGAGGAAESSFIVTQPFLMEPILPRFALRGDDLFLAAMVHNNTTTPVSAKVVIAGEVREIALPPKGKERVAVGWKAEASRDVSMTLEVLGQLRDRVEKRIEVGLPGTEEHPQLSGVFRDPREITVEIPEDAVFANDAALVVRTGSSLYPELGQRLAYLHEYPHGCVEQTTSSTLPYVAAKNILAWTGAKGLSEEELRKRVAFGVKRLASMKTSDGGLGYWPGDAQSNEMGTAYAARLLLRAEEMEIAEKGLLPGVLAYLGKRLTATTSPTVKVAIAQVLAEADRLDDSFADALWDTREKLDPYGSANLALALSSLSGQKKRVQELLDGLERSFDDQGVPKTPHGKDDWVYWSSPDRDRAQALVALVKLRPKSKTALVLARRLSKRVEGYTTQTTAWSLVAMSDYIGSEGPRGKVDVKVKVEGRIVDTVRTLGGGNKEVAVPLAELRGKTVVLRLEGQSDTPSAFTMEARYARPDDASPHLAKRQALGPTIHRVYTDAKGDPVDLGKLAAGDVVRVALRAEVKPAEAWRGVYLAMSDRFAAGFEPVETDLASVASVPDVGPSHPFYGHLGSGHHASHVDVRRGRVNVYFDRAYGAVYATYLLRAVTPGTYAMPAAHGELMYEPGSEGYSDSQRVTIR